MSVSRFQSPSRLFASPMWQHPPSDGATKQDVWSNAMALRGLVLGAALLSACGTARSQAIPASSAATPDNGTAPAHYAAHPSRMLGAPVIRPVPQSRDGSRAMPEDAQSAIKAALGLPPATTAPAPFLGNFTAITASSGNGLLLARQQDCSLSAANVPYSYNVSDPYNEPQSVSTHYDQALHSQAGLATRGGVFSRGCADPRVGIVSSDLLYAGESTGGMRMAAVAAYSPSAQKNVLYTFVTKDDGTFVGSAQPALPSTNEPFGVAAGDLNGDGNPDIIAVGYQNVNGVTTSAITVLLGHADGTFTVGQTYTLGAGITDSVVIDDFNGDGKLDVVIPVNGVLSKFSGNAGTLAFYPGNGDGTFGAPQTLPLATAVESLASGDLNGDGKKDLVSGTGSILLGNGDGTFQLLTTPAFPLLTTSSSATAQVALADFNADGKLDIAAGTGADIHIYLGKGDGTFTTGNVYAAIDNHGGLIATDLDGDGNIDLFSGSGRAGIFTGDDFSANEGYALMGLGNGSFLGAPVLNYASFNTMQDLNGDGKLDFIGISDNSILVSKPVFGTYYGRGDGTFQQMGASLAASNFTYSGTSYQITNVDSYVTTDLNGDGKPDLVYLPTDYFTQRPIRLGFISALANGDGSFQSPTFTPIPALLPGQDAPQGLTNLKSALNQSGHVEIVYAYQDVTFIPNTSGQYSAGYVTQLSNGDGTFAAPVTTQTYFSTITGTTLGPPEILAFTDMNGDKIPDLVTFTAAVYGNGGVITTPAQLQVLLGKSDGTFSAPMTIPVVANPVDTTLAIGDLNGDGVPDIAIEGSTSSGNNLTPLIGIALGKGDGTFNVLAPLMAGTGGFEALSIGDYTGDGKADLAAVSFTGELDGIFPGNGDGTVQSTPRNNGTNTVVPPLALLLYNSAGAGTPAAGYDVNGDGKLDLIAGGTVLLQTSAPSTLASTATALTATPTTVVTGNTVALAAMVSATAGLGTPSGTVTFTEGSTSLGTATLDGTGKAMLNVSTFAVGSHTVVATYSGDSTFAASTSTTVAVTVTAAPPTVTSIVVVPSASNAVQGTNITFTAQVTTRTAVTSTPAGNVTFLSGTTVLGTAPLNTSAVATFSTTQLPIGANSITVQYAGNSTFASAVSQPVTVNITAPLAASATTLSASVTSINLGQSVTFTARVAAAAANSNTPGGTVTFLLGSTALGTGTLTGGTATLTTTQLPVGTDAVNASYAGDANFSASTSPAVSIAVANVPSDFTFTLSPASATVKAGSTTATTLTVQPVGGFSQAVTFTCSGLPAHTSCAFSPSTVTPSGGAAATSQLTFTTNTATARLVPSPNRRGSGGRTATVAAICLGLCTLAGVRRRRPRSAGLLRIVAAAALLAGLSGCGGSGNRTPTGTANVTVTATAGSTSHSATFALTVQ